MRKWTLRILAAVGLFAMVLPVFVALVNRWDEPVRPEVQKILDKQPEFTEQQKKSYYYVLGLYAGEKENPEKIGTELWTKRDEPGFWKKLAQTESNPWKTNFGGCPNNTCNVQTLIDHPELVEVLKAHQEVIQNYVHLVEYGEGANILQTDPETIFSPINTLPFKVHRLFQLQLAQWVRQGGQVRVLDLIAQSNRMLQGHLRKGNLLERLIATVLLRDNLEFIAAELKRNPKFRVTQDLIDSISVPDVHDLMYGAAEVELRTFENAVHSINSVRHLEMASFGNSDSDGDSKSIKDRLPVRMALRPNETVNMYYEITQQILSSDCPNTSELKACVPLLKWASFSNPWHFVSNPVGRGLTAVMVSSINQRKRVQDRLDKIGALREEIAGTL